MRWNLRAANQLYREPHRDQDFDGILPGDVYEFTDPPFYEVDPKTRTCRESLQCFRVIDESLTLQPVARGSWLPQSRNQEKRFAARDAARAKAAG